MMIPFKIPRATTSFKMPKPVAPFSKSRAAMMQHLLSGGVGARGSSLKNDDFNDNVRDATFWDTYLVLGGTVLEQNQRLECTQPVAVGAQSGYVTVNGHDLTTCDISVLCNHNTTDRIRLVICLTKVTVTSFISELNWYSISKNRLGFCQVERMLAGVYSQPYSAAYGAQQSIMRIAISGGTVSFYESGANILNQAYPFGTYINWIYIATQYEGSAWPPPFMGWHDDFLGSN